MKKEEIKQIIKEELEKLFEEEVDEESVKELVLFITNDADLYRQQLQPIQKNLITKMARGVYDGNKAVKLFMYLMDNGAKKYAQEFDDISRWNVIFPKSVRIEAAKQFVEDFETEAQLGNYDNYLPKKYQKQ